MSYLLAYNPYNTNLFMRSRSIDPSAAAYFTATGITGATQQTAIDNLVKGLKADGLWSKMKAVYPFVTDNRNLLSYTEDFGNAYWFKSNATVTTNSTLAPNGTTTADTVIDDNVANFHFVRTATGETVSSGSVYTLSCYLKNNTRRYCGIHLNDGTARGCSLDLQTGTLGTPYGGATASVTNVGNGWYRLSVTATLTSATNNPAFYLSDSNSLASYTGNGSSVFMWGAQLELGSTATTYQPIATTQQAFISSQFKYNLVNPVDSDAAFRLVFNGGWTHSSNGATPNGTNGYADTKFIPSSSLSTSSAHFAKYNRTNDLVNFKLDGCSVTGVSPETFLQHNYTGANAVIGDVTSLATYIPTDTRGLFNATRTSTNTFKVFRNTTNIGSNTTLITVLPNRSVYLGARNDVSGTAFYNTYQAAFASIGDGLTDTEAANLYTRVQAFQNSLNRAVI